MRSAWVVVLFAIGCTYVNVLPLGLDAAVIDFAASPSGDLALAPADLAPPPDLAPAPCGHPGAKGNSLGVGSYCDTQQDCSGNSQATICSELGAPGTHFCTMPCQTANAGQCGAAASCVCNGRGCGCQPFGC